MNAAQAAALAKLEVERARFSARFPNQWIAVSANDIVGAAPSFEPLAADPNIDPARVVFAFIAVGAWA
jgi:hypothetical protein